MPVDSYRLCIESGSSRGGRRPWSRTLVIALALIEGRLYTGEAFARSQFDESCQIDVWGGEDAEQAERRAALAADGGVHLVAEGVNRQLLPGSSNLCRKRQQKARAQQRAHAPTPYRLETRPRATVMSR